MLFAAIMCSCSHSEKSKSLSGASKDVRKVASEYRNSGKWGKVVNRELELGEFNGFHTEGNIEVVFKQADTYSVKAIGHEGAIEQYDFNIDNNGCLMVRQKDDVGERYDNIPEITLLIKSPRLKNVIMSGGDVELKGELVQNDSLNIYVEGNGDVYAKSISVDALNIEVSGNGDVEIRKAGITGDAKVIVNGDGNIDGKLKCDNAIMEVNGSGSIDIDIKCKDLTARCNGRGEIELKGKCRTLRKRKGAGGRIDSHNLTVEKEILLDK